MARVLLLLTLLSYYTGVRSQATLTQPASMSASLGQTAKLSCTKSSGGSWQSWFTWLQQKPGQPPRFVIFGGDGYTTSKGEGIPDRFTISSSGNVGSLTISNLQAEDEAVYSCASWYSTGSMYVFGGGTHLNVLGRPAVPPIVHVFPPSSEELKTKKTGTLVCLVDKFYPSAVQVTWTVDGAERAEGVETTRPTKQGDAYMASSYLTLSENDWSGHDIFVCKVAHDGKNYDKSVKRSECS